MSEPNHTTRPGRAYFFSFLKSRMIAGRSHSDAPSATYMALTLAGTFAVIGSVGSS